MSFTPSLDPFVPLPTPAVIQARGLDWLREFILAREQTIAAAKEDPLRYGHELSTWRDARDILRDARFLLALGGNGSAKTMLAARLCMEILCPDIVCSPAREAIRLRPRSKTGQPPSALLISPNPNSSLTLQNYVYDHIPPEWRPVEGATRKRSITSRITFNRSTGFGEASFSLPNGAMAKFGTYHQWTQDNMAFEGPKYDAIFCDEDAPLELIETLRNRLYERNGILFQGFTPIDGITPAIRAATTGAKTIRAQRAELLPEDYQTGVHQDYPPGHLPYIQKSVKPKSFVLYMPTKANPASEYAERAKDYVTMPPNIIARRLYGFADNTIATRFPMFGDTHLIDPADIPKEGTNYHILDLADARNYVMIWWRVAPDGMNYIYDEWPDPPMGPWAVPSKDPKKHDGDPGPAQTGRGYSIDEDYKRIILTAEGNHCDENGKWTYDGQAIEERLIDPRAGASEKQQAKGGALTVIEMFNDAEPYIDFRAASGKDESEGIQAINNLLKYNPLKPLVKHHNHPRLMVSRKCENLIWAMLNYTGHDGPKAACKDFIDCLRYAALEKFQHYPVKGRVKVKPKGYGN